MSTELTMAQRATLESVAELMMPATQGMPTATEAEVPTAGIDRVLALRPELIPVLSSALTAISDRSPSSIDELREWHAGAVHMLGEALASAYFTAPVVLEKFPELRRPRRPLPDLHHLAAELDSLTQTLLSAGPRFRVVAPVDGVPRNGSVPTPGRMENA